MYVREIHIENIRGFGEGQEGVHLDLTRPDGSLAGWTVIAGRNGTGKSTLLKAVALAVAGPHFAGAIQMQGGVADWIRRGVEDASVRVTMERGPQDKILRKGARRKQISAELRWRKDPAGAEPVLESDGEDASQGPWAVNPQGWMIAGYGPFRRIAPREEHAEPGSAMMSRLRSLFDTETILNEPIQWLRTAYMKWLDTLRKAKDARENGRADEAERLEAQAVEHDRLNYRVLTLLNNELLPRGTKIAGFDMDGLWIERDGVVLHLNSLSDGYRTAIALVFDLVYRIARCYSEFTITEEISEGQERVTVPYEGVVLIDESRISISSGRSASGRGSSGTSRTSSSLSPRTARSSARRRARTASSGCPAPTTAGRRGLCPRTSTTSWSTAAPTTR